MGGESWGRKMVSKEGRDESGADTFGPQKVEYRRVLLGGKKFLFVGSY